MQKYAGFFLVGTALVACQARDIDVSAEAGAKGENCNPTYDPNEDPDGGPCAPGLVCDPVAGSEDFVCGTPLQIHGMVVDALTLMPLPGALINGLDRTGAPLGLIAVSDAVGHFELPVTAPRDPTGEIAADAKYTLQGFAVDYQPFPSGIRVALPISAGEAVLDQTLGAYVIENPGTTVGLVQLPSGQRGGVTVTGHVRGVAPGGALVVAEGAVPTSYGVSDAAGAYTLFNVHDGAVNVVGYRRGLELKPHAITVAGAALVDIDLEVIAEGVDRLATVSGSVQLVNAGDGVGTSVVLVPLSVFNGNLLRGPVPFGLRAPDPGLGPDIRGDWTIRGVPAGTYKVLAAFENDDLVRDPDLNIGGTELQELTVTAGQDTSPPGSFKVTGALAVTSPGRDEPEAVQGTPIFVFADDSSEDRYVVRVFDVFGELRWEDTMVPKVAGSTTVQVNYGGPALPAGYYQFRAISVRKDVPISATEDLRGVFLVRP